MTHAFNSIQEGWDAYGSDGEKVGGIQDVGPNYVHVSKGLILTTDLFIPESAIEGMDPDRGRVILSVPASQVDQMGWDEPPMDDTGYAGTYDERAEMSGRGATIGATTGSEDYGRPTAYERTTDLDTDYGHGRDVTSSGVDDTLRVPVREEELRTSTREREAGEVEIGKRVVEEQREMDVPVSHDEVQVRRVQTNRPATGDEGVFQDGDTIRVPVMAEEVEVRKEPRVVEEIEIDKRRLTEDERVSDRVRREEVDIRESGNVAAMGSPGTGEEDEDRY